MGTEIPRIDYREEERQTGTTHVYNIVEQLQFILDQYGDLLPAHVVAEARKSIAVLDVYDKKLSNHLFIVDRRMASLEKRIKEAEDSGEIATRTDIPWVRQELAMLKWVRNRV